MNMYPHVRQFAVYKVPFYRGFDKLEELLDATVQGLPLPLNGLTVTSRLPRVAQSPQNWHASCFHCQAFLCPDWTPDSTDSSSGWISTRSYLSSLAAQQGSTFSDFPPRDAKRYDERTQLGPQGPAICGSVSDVGWCRVVMLVMWGARH